MGNNPKHKRIDKPAGDKEKERRFQWWQLVVPAVVTLLGIFIQQSWDSWFNSTPPEFALINPIQRPDSAITIEAQNDAAAKKKNLTVEFDGLKFPNAGILQSNSEPPLWRFILQGRGIPDSLLRDGRHSVRAGFAGEKLGEPMTILFNTQAPLVSVEVKHPPGKPNERIFIGRAVSRLPSPADTLSVDIAFNTGGSKPVEMPVPVKRVIEESTGRTYFEFETTVQGLPKIWPKDPRYAEPFFALRITDAAGNRQYQEESYAQFTAPGDKRFGSTKAEIEFKRLPVEVPLKGFGKLDKSGNMKLTFRVTPRVAALTQLANGQPAIILRVTSIAGNIRQLDWTSYLPDSLRMPQPVTTILRNEQQLGHAFANQFVDEKAPSNREAIYRVEQAGRDGKVYSSNNAQAVKPPEFLSEEAVQKMLQENNLFDIRINPSGKGISHQYREVERNSVKLVIDDATGLTWQKGGSERRLTFEAAQAYVDSLNATNHGGYNDWRLPTLKEAMQLMEREWKSGGLLLYLALVFDRTQLWIWTSDNESAGRAWVVVFNYGYCYRSGVVPDGYVRAVRS